MSAAKHKEHNKLLRELSKAPDGQLCNKTVTPVLRFLEKHQGRRHHFLKCLIDDVVAFSTGSQFALTIMMHIQKEMEEMERL